MHRSRSSIKLFTSVSAPNLEQLDQKHLDEPTLKYSRRSSCLNFISLNNVSSTEGKDLNILIDNTMLQEPSTSNPLFSHRKSMISKAKEKYNFDIDSLGIQTLTPRHGTLISLKKKSWFEDLISIQTPEDGYSFPPPLCTDALLNIVNDNPENDDVKNDKNHKFPSSFPENLLMPTLSDTEEECREDLKLPMKRRNHQSSFTREEFETWF